MKNWLAYRFGMVAVASVLVYIFINMVLMSIISLSPAQWQSSTWIAISITWAIGLVIVKSQFNQLPEDPEEEGKKPFNLKDLLRKEKPQENKQSDTLLEQPDSPLLPGLAPEHSHNPGPGSMNMGKMVETAVGKSMADAEVSMELELPSGTKLEILGQEVDVKKGKIKLKPRKRKEQRMKDIFDDKVRRRRA